MYKRQVGCDFWGHGRDGKGSDHFAKLLVKARIILTSDPIDSHVARDTNPADESHVANNEPRPSTSLATQVPPPVDSHVAKPCTSLASPQIDSHVATTSGSTSLVTQVSSEKPDTSPDSSHASPLNSTPRSPTPNRGWEIKTPLTKHTNQAAPGTPAGGTRSRARRDLASTLSPGDGGQLSSGDSQPAGILNKHSKTNKASWQLNNVEKPILVIGDSNCAIFQAPKSNFQIESFPGGRFHNIRIMLEQSLANKINTTLAQHVIISIGINDLKNKPHTTTVPEMRKVIHLANKIFPNATVHLAQINFSQDLPAQSKDNLRDLNHWISTNSLVCTSHIKRLAHSKFRVQGDNIHWTQNTANAFLEHWSSSLKLPHF